MLYIESFSLCVMLIIKVNITKMTKRTENYMKLSLPGLSFVRFQPLRKLSDMFDPFSQL